MQLLLGGAIGSVLVASVVYTALLFSDYPAAFTEKKTLNDRTKKNHPAPIGHEGVLRFHLYGIHEWNESALLDYRVYGFNSTSLGEGVPPEILPSVNFDDDSTCFFDIRDRIAAEVKWRGNTRPPLKPSYKIKLYYCKCDDSDCEWKKKKIDEDDTGIGYTGSKTNKFTFRSDRQDFINVYDKFSTELFSHLGAKDDMWSRPSLLRINNDEMGLYMFMTSPDESLLPVDEDEELAFFFKYDQTNTTPNAITNSDVELKWPDPDDFCMVELTDDCVQDAEVNTILNNFRPVLDAFENGTAVIDFPTMAARFWLNELIQDMDSRRSVYFYQHTNGTVFAGPMWDAGQSFNSPINRCDTRRASNPNGWLPDVHQTLYAPFLENNPAFLQYTIALYRDSNINEFVQNFKENLNELKPLIRYDWSLWDNAHTFECQTAVFQIQDENRGYGGIEKWSVEDIDTQLSLWLEFLDQRVNYLDAHYQEAGTRTEKKPDTHWGNLFIAFVTLWSVFVALLVIALVMWLLQKKVPYAKVETEFTF